MHSEDLVGDGQLEVTKRQSAFRYRDGRWSTKYNRTVELRAFHRQSMLCSEFARGRTTLWSQHKHQPCPGRARGLCRHLG